MQQRKQAATLLLRRGDTQTLEAYLKEREALGVSVQDSVHGSFTLGLLSSLLVKRPEGNLL